MYELTSDLLIQCTGGTPPTGAAPILQLKLSFGGTPVTSRVLDAATAATEAFAILNEPYNKPQILCPTPTAPAACAVTANVYPGLRTGASELTWNLPTPEPGDSGFTLLRLTNLRVRTPATPPLTQDPINATVTITGAGAPSVTGNSGITTAQSQDALSAGTPTVDAEGSCASGGPVAVRTIRIKLRESSFPSAFRRRNEARATASNFAPAPVAQDLPGIIYQTETGFYNPAFAGVYATAGLANHGARVYLRLAGVPAGVTMSTPSVLALSSRNSFGYSPGIAARVTTDANGAGSAVFPATAPTPVEMVARASGVLEAVYETVENDTTAFEEMEIPVTVTYSGGTAVSLAGLTYDYGFAPTAASSSFQRFDYPTGAAAVAVPGVAPCGTGGSIVPAPPSSAGLTFVPVTPCRVADTREDRTGGFGKPALASGVEREFALPLSGCGLPATARAYSLNFTVVPKGPLGYITVFPSQTPSPFVSTLNSIDGRVKANAAIVPAGQSGKVSVIATDPTELIIDVNGYFVLSSAAPQGLAFYPLAPCRIADTRFSGSGTAIPAGGQRDFSVLGGNCGVPASAQAYSLNATVVPSGPLGYLTLWPTGQPQPFVSTLNSPRGEIVANAAIVPAGTNGSVSAFVQGASHLVLDLNGYFAPPGAANAQRFFPVQPCRLYDSRQLPAASLDRFGFLPPDVDYRVSPLLINCGIGSNATAYALNVTVPVAGVLGYLTMWPNGQPRPFVSTLNAITDVVVANAAIVPAGTFGDVNFFLTNQANVVLDVSGFFAP